MASSPSLRFLIAPDKFKGSLDASGIARAMARGVRRVYPKAKLRLAPLADGGEGTAALLADVHRATKYSLNVHAPQGDRVRASWSFDGRTAWLDLAAASGLALIPPHQRNPLRTSTRGLGELMHHAVRRGARRLILGVGGSGTVDGGMGALRSLGIRFFDSQDREIPDGGGELYRLDRVDFQNFLWKKQRVEIVMLADVRNPLLGPTGSAVMFGPQKGATPAMVRRLEAGLKRLNQIILKLGRPSEARAKHAGAAGGIVAGFRGILGSFPNLRVRVTSGIDYVLEGLNVERHVRTTDWILTGEGRLDDQTEHGKTISGLCALARRHRKPVLAFVGQLRAESRALRRMGIHAAISLVSDPRRVDGCRKNSAAWMTRAVVQKLPKIVSASR